MRDSENGIRREKTDYGFVLIVPEGNDKYFLEAYGMSGIGRYEMFFACACTTSDIPEMLAEATKDEMVPVYRQTVVALRKT